MLMGGVGWRRDLRDQLAIRVIGSGKSDIINLFSKQMLIDK
jgi:hypothetical protein